MFLTLARRQSQRAMNLAEMTDRLGIDPLATPVVANLIGAAAAVCSWCPHVSACRMWLDQRSGPISDAPEFCTNRDRLAAARPKSRKT